MPWNNTLSFWTADWVSLFINDSYVKQVLFLLPAASTYQKSPAAFLFYPSSLPKQKVELNSTRKQPPQKKNPKHRERYITTPTCKALMQTYYLSCCACSSSKDASLPISEKHTEHKTPLSLYQQTYRHFRIQPLIPHEGKQSASCPICWIWYFLPLHASKLLIIYKPVCNALVYMLEFTWFIKQNSI